jgi:hypothetical protein
MCSGFLDNAELVTDGRLPPLCPPPHTTETDQELQRESERETQVWSDSRTCERERESGDIRERERESGDSSLV